MLLTLVAAAAPVGAQEFNLFGVGQSFTAPTTGSTVLQQLIVGPRGITGNAIVGGTAPYTVRLFAFDGTAPIGSSLFSQVLGFGAFSGFTLTPNLLLTAGNRYTLFMNQVVGGGIGYSSAGDEGNLGGFLFACNGSADSCAPPFGGVSPDVLGFRALYGGPSSTVPEPGTWSLMSAGLLALGAFARRKQTKA